MQNIKLGKLKKLIIHSVGNKNNEDGIRFSDSLTDFESLQEIIRKLMGSSFKFDELCQFYFCPESEFKSYKQIEFLVPRLNTLICNFPNKESNSTYFKRNCICH